MVSPSGWSCRIKKRESSRRYNKNNPEKAKFRGKKWRKLNNEKKKEYEILWTKNNLEKRRAQKRKYANSIKGYVKKRKRELIKSREFNLQKLEELQNVRRTI